MRSLVPFANSISTGLGSVIGSNQPYCCSDPGAMYTSHPLTFATGEALVAFFRTKSDPFRNEIEIMDCYVLSITVGWSLRGADNSLAVALSPNSPQLVFFLMSFDQDFSPAGLGSYLRSSFTNSRNSLTRNLGFPDPPP